MCGIAGFVGGKWSSQSEQTRTLAAMARSIRHRGPDHSAVWLDLESRVGFAHNRLAIIDVSPAGNQPMHSHSGRYVIVYNGEIYNHHELRKQLEDERAAFNWTGHSDTETLLAAVDAWGVRKALERSVGMFAFALWDKREHKLILARDRIGEKPLYYGRQTSAGPFLFGSELKALAQHPQFTPEINRQALALFMRFTYIPTPYSIYRGIAKLRPGCFLTLSGDGGEPVIEEYWSARRVAEAGAADRLQASPEECTDQLEGLLTRAVGQQMIADVALGAFLSGGVDSSTVVALMQKQSLRPVKTFSIGFQEERFDEARHARAVARHLGTDHTELYVTPSQAMAVLPSLPSMYDEPFADSSQIPTYLVAALARRHVTVSLSGDAGDELFGGYNRYGLASALWRKLRPVPRPVRSAAAAALGALPLSLWNRVTAAASGALPALAHIRDAGAKIHQRAPLFGCGSAMELYGGIVSQWLEPNSLVVGATEPPSLATSSGPPLRGLSLFEQMMAADTVTYLPDEILVKLDRASMAVSLETRVPLLDHRVVEFASRVPFEYKVRDGQMKWVLRQVLYRHVPPGLVERPKMGFGVPVGDWLKGPLRDWAETLLGESRLRDEGYLRPRPIRQAWVSHLADSVGGDARLWSVLMFQSWLEDHHAEIRSIDAPAAGQSGPLEQVNLA
ncbi:MAG TPA: asparagine synthase (glutamine-hydrolyzing) [Sphingomicrobium sp.]|nr:asparagine synthase (glutamine-hydrolyzing) [Sphingomicrobium sp.]